VSASSSDPPPLLSFYTPSGVPSSSISEADGAREIDPKRRWHSISVGMVVLKLLFIGVTDDNDLAIIGRPKKTYLENIDPRPHPPSPNPPPETRQKAHCAHTLWTGPPEMSPSVRRSTVVKTEGERKATSTLHSKKKMC
jgi:hypothetical protein